MLTTATSNITCDGSHLCIHPSALPLRAGVQQLRVGREASGGKSGADAGPVAATHSLNHRLDCRGEIVLAFCQSYTLSLSLSHTHTLSLSLSLSPLHLTHARTHVGLTYNPHVRSFSCFSCQITGALTYPASKRCFENDRGCYTFNCSFGASTYAFLWLDDHLVCQSGAYAPKPNTFDGSEGNPLRVLNKNTVVVRLRAYWSPHGHRLDSGDVALRTLVDNNNATLGWV